MNGKIGIGILILMSTTAFAGDNAAGGKKKPAQSEFAKRLGKYATIRLEFDSSNLTKSQRRMVPILIEAAEKMDDAFWIQACGGKDAVLKGITDPDAKRFAEINYGPWDRFDGNKPFIDGIGPKPPGANFYPKDMSKQEFERAVAAADPKRAKALTSSYTMIRRGKDGKLTAVPYHEFFAPQMHYAAARLIEAAGLAKDRGLKNYLLKRASAFYNDNYQPSDLAWMDMKDNVIDFVVGPIETYEDALFGYKAAFEAYVLVKDVEWSARLAKYAELLPALQRGLPVADAYKAESPGSDADLNAYDVLYYAGDCNAGAKTLAINLPNDPVVQLKKGTRRLQLKNAMRAKYDAILLPISNLLIAEDQRKHITFDAFFGNTLFHEVAHGLGIKMTLKDKKPIREVLKEEAGAVEEGKADVLGLYMVGKLREQGVVTDGQLMDNYVTFLAGTFRSVRFGAASAHGRANMLRFNYFEELGAFSRDSAAGVYRVNLAEMKHAVESLSHKILTLQGDGDYAGAGEIMRKYGKIGTTLQADLDRVNEASIPVDVVFEQGMSVLH